MENIKLSEFNIRALSLFKKTREALKISNNECLNSKAQDVPATFIDNGKKIRIVFAGQYSAGKSTILSNLTGLKLETGQGITTNKCQYIDWKGIEVVDTPGIHTQGRADHDAITYEAMSEADLIIFVCTAEGFGDHLGKHFRKLLVEKGKGKELMLVFNKMEDSLYGNTEKGRRILYENDVLPVISPEYTADDLYISYIDSCAYQDAMEEEGEEREEDLQISGYPEFFKQLDRFVKDKKLAGKCTTSLYRLEQLLSEVLASFHSGDELKDGSLELLNQQRQMLLESKFKIKNESYHIIRKKTQDIRLWGDNLADQLSSATAEGLEGKIKEKWEESAIVYENATAELKSYIEQEMISLQQKISDFQKSEFFSCMKDLFNRQFEKFHLSKDGAKNLGSYANKVKDAGVWLSRLATGPNAQTGWNAIFKMTSYSGSKAHQVVYQTGKFFGHKFKPWEAVRIAGKIGKFGKALGLAGAVGAVALEAYSTHQENKIQRELDQARGEIRNSFSDRANEINMQFDEGTQSWIAENYDSRINDIDKTIQLIESSIANRDQEFQTYKELLDETRQLISEIQESIA